MTKRSNAPNQASNTFIVHSIAEQFNQGVTSEIDNGSVRNEIDDKRVAGGQHIC